MSLDRAGLMAGKDGGRMMLGRRKSEQVRGRERSVASTDGAPQIPAMPLSLARSGATVTRVKGSGEVKRHLETLGFVEGSEVHVVATGGGNIIVVVKGARFGLDAKVATNVLVA